eukprot:14897056-Alexandrium_andersonii.AAC.1
MALPRLPAQLRPLVGLPPEKEEASEKEEEQDDMDCEDGQTHPHKLTQEQVGDLERTAKVLEATGQRAAAEAIAETLKQHRDQPEPSPPT